jgi:murein DD-endopeptidase MepM/ murein hydrolase activator NlpD
MPLPARSTGPRKRKIRNWFLAWFRKETRALILLNTVLSVVVLAFALPLAPLGFAQIASPILRAEGALQPFRISAYVGMALLAVAAFTLSHAHIFRRGHPYRKTFATILSITLAATGAWLLAVSFYADSMPKLLKPDTALAAGHLVTELEYYNAQVAPLILPGLAVLAAFLLSAKQLKSAIAAWRGRGRKLLSLLGLATSLSALAIGAYAAQAREFGIELGSVRVADAPAANVSDAFAPPFAAGVPCHVSDNFGERRNPFDLSHYEFHPGVDIGVAAGTAVHAMASGTVLFAGDSGGYGNMVAITVKDGVQSMTLVSGHLERLFVRRGDLVSSGDVIGDAGSTGRSTGPHLHLQVCSDARVTRFGTFVCGAAQNPYEMWHTLSAIARASCTHGPTVSSTDLVSWNWRAGLASAMATVTRSSW